VPYSLVNIPNNNNIEQITKKQKNSCPVCNKKITFSEQSYCKCKCGNTYCSRHRYPGHDDSDNTHKCNYDHKLEHMEKLIKSNPVVKPNKLIS